MSSIRTRADSGFLFFDFRINSIRCREQTTLLDTPENRASTEKVLAQIDLEIKTGTFDYAKHFPNSRQAKRFSPTPVAAHAVATSIQVVPESPDTIVTFGEFAETWMAELSPMWRIATRNLHRTLLNRYLLPAFAAKPIAAISRADLLQFRATLITTPRGKRDKPLAPASVNHVLKLLRAILAEAASRYSFQDPAAKLKRVKIPRSDIAPFSLDQVRLILSRCRPDYVPYFVVRFFTGMRSGEIHGLKWSRVDFERRQILVRETFGHGRVEYTKTDGSQREIEISSVVLAALKTQLKATGSREYVFCNLKGEPLDEGNVTKRVWYPLLRNLNLALRRPYQTRHTAATLWLAAGEAPEWIARQLGHTTTEMLFRVYSRYIPNLTRQDGAAFESLMSAAMGSTVMSAVHRELKDIIVEAKS